MTFDYEVKHNGIYYPAGANVPIEETNGGGKEAPAVIVSGKVETDSVSARKYTEEDLNLPYMKLKALAKKEGFKVPNTLKSDELKEMLRGIV